MFTKRQYLGGAGTFCGFCIVALDARDKVHARKNGKMEISSSKLRMWEKIWTHTKTELAYFYYPTRWDDERFCWNSVGFCIKNKKDWTKPVKSEQIHTRSFVCKRIRNKKNTQKGITSI